MYLLCNAVALCALKLGGPVGWLHNNC
jgi:hypothetical protein